MTKFHIVLFLSAFLITVLTASPSPEFLKAEKAIAEDDYELAIELYSSIIESDPENAEAYFLRGVANLEETDDDLALDDLNKAQELGYKNIYLYYYRGLSYESLIEYDKAISDLTVFLDDSSSKPDSILIKAYKSRGWCRNDLKDYSGSIEDCTKAIELNPMDVNANFQRATVLFKDKQYAKSINEFIRLAKLFPKKNKIARKRIIFIKLETGDYSGVIRDCTQLLDEGYRKCSLYQLRAEAYLGLKDYEKALADIKTALNDFEKHEKILDYRKIAQIKARAILGLGYVKDAESYINKALQQDPDNTEFLKIKQEILEASKKK